MLNLIRCLFTIPGHLHHDNADGDNVDYVNFDDLNEKSWRKKTHRSQLWRGWLASDGVYCQGVSVTPNMNFWWVSDYHVMGCIHPKILSPKCCIMDVAPSFEVPGIYFLDPFCHYEEVHAWNPHGQNDLYRITSLLSKIWGFSHIIYFSSQVMLSTTDWFNFDTFILTITISSIIMMKKCDDPIKESGEGPKENVLQYSSASSPFTMLVMVVRNNDNWWINVF